MHFSLSCLLWGLSLFAPNLGFVSGSICPPTAVITPCTCDSDSRVFGCNSKENFDLKGIFRRMRDNAPEAETDFNLFYLNDCPSISEMPENVFNGFQFKVIQLSNNRNLKRVDSQAFRGTENATEQALLYHNQIAGNGVFEALQPLRRLERVDLSGNRLEALPSHAFGDIERLQKLFLGSNLIGDVGNWALDGLPNLGELQLENNAIEALPANAFHFKRPSGDRLELRLGNNALSGEGIGKALANINKPTELSLWGNSIRSLEESVFRPFLDRFEGNTVRVNNNPIQCDCDMKWLMEGKSIYRPKVLFLTCPRLRSFWQLEERDLNC